MRSMLAAIMSHPLLSSRPPVFVDIGASGALPKQWGPVAQYSICVAFEPDHREFRISQTESHQWKRLYTVNRLVSPEASGLLEFYLTQSPFCSSSLKPNYESLAKWAFAPLFGFDKTSQLPAVDLTVALKSLGIDQVDWYKSDSQGTDLRIFRALGEEIQRKILVADFEPGIIDAYHGEDKLYDLMAYMDKRPFWMSDMKVLGSQRIDQTDFISLRAPQRRRISWILRTSPGWCEVTYLNSLDEDTLSCREYFLAWVFATIKGEHGFAIHAARVGGDKFGDPLFKELQLFSHKALRLPVTVYVVQAAAKALRMIRGKR